MFLRHTGFFGEIWGMLGACFWGALHRFGDQRSGVGISLGCWGVLGGALEVLGGTLGSFGCLLGGPWASLGPWQCPGSVLGGPWCDFGGLGRSLGESWEIKMLIFLQF